MTVSSLTNRNDFVGNGATKIFSYSFKIFLDTELEVKVENLVGEVTTLTLTTDYTVTGVGETAGGTITLVDSSQAWLSGGFLITDYKISIQRTRALNQETDIRNQGDFFPETHEDEFDKQVMTDQQLDRLAQRSLKLPFTEVPTSAKVILPSLADRLSKFLAFDSSGNPIASAGGIDPSIPVSAFMQTVLDDVTAILARATLDAVGLIGNETIAGNKTFSGATIFSAALAAALAMGGNKITGLAAATVDGDALRFEQLGHLGQVIQNIKTGAVSVTTATFTDTGLSITITPKSTSSKILIHVTMPIGLTNAGSGSVACGVKVLRDAVEIYKTTNNSFHDIVSKRIDGTITLSFRDEPATGSAVIYKVQINNAPANGTVRLNPDAGPTKGAVMLVMEELP